MCSAAPRHKNHRAPVRDERATHAANGGVADRRSAPKDTSTDTIERALDALLEEQNKHANRRWRGPPLPWPGRWRAFFTRGFWFVGNLIPG
jgi:hypothetical protein